MQRARRRFVCSTASLSSSSKNTLRPQRRSRTSSAGGDGFLMSKEPRNQSSELSSEMKPRSTKYNMRLLSSNLRNSKKIRKPSKSLRPSLGSLQNTIVLAPFHTLKKCFQSKLVDLYSHEKMKTINHKIKMAKRQNMAFEYDVIELRKLNSKKSKTETRPPTKKQAIPTKKQKGRSRSQSYCQCQKNESKSRVPPKKGRSSRTKTQLDPFEGQHFSGPSGSKKRKTINQMFIPATLKLDPTPRLDFLSKCNESFQSLRPSNTNVSASAASSHSRVDSWETFSDSPSCREERLEGSMALSTTSFGSYLEQFDKNSRQGPKTNRSRPSRLKPLQLTEMNGIAEGDPLDADSGPKPNLDGSGHLAVKRGKRSSNGRLIDFLDREPQAQTFSSAEGGQRLQPLRPQSKTRTKKPESDSSGGYYLRSLGTSKEKINVEGNPTVMSNRIEAHPQVEGNIDLRERQHSNPPQELKSIDKQVLDTTALEPEARDGSSVFTETSPNSNSQKPHEPTTTVKTIYPPCDPSAFEDTGSNIEIPEFQDESDSAVRGQEASKQHESNAETASIVMLPEVEDGRAHQESSNLDRGIRQAEEKESVYIFGSRATPTRLGESCEFSFGLNWEFSDDDDSNQGDHFF